MPSLTQLMKAAQADLPITMRHERWLQKNSNPVYSLKAIEHAMAVLSGKKGGYRPRAKSFRSSGAGQCHRKRVFGYIGLKQQQPLDAGGVVFFHTGNFMHLKWQMAGLTEGWLTEAEVPAHNVDLRLTGTFDGVVCDGSLFEFKSINDRGWSYVMKDGPKPEHIAQTTAYTALRPGMETVSVVYENKNSGDWREFRFPQDPHVRREFLEEMELLNAHVDKRVLPRIKPLCLQHEGREYRQCPYSQVCLTIKDYDEAEAMS